MMQQRCSHCTTLLQQCRSHPLYQFSNLIECVTILQQLLPVKMVKVEGLVFQQCSTGGSHTALSTNEGKMYTCGWGMFCGRGKTENSLTPEIVPAMDGKHVRQIECGRSQTACVTDIGEIWNWGIGACGQLGHGDDEDRLLPALVAAIQSEVWPWMVLLETCNSCGYRVLASCRVARCTWL